MVRACTDAGTGGTPMNRIFRLILLSMLIVTSFGCARNYYNVPKETYESKVKVLGVTPIFVDGASDIKHPEKEGVVAIAKDSARKNERKLVRMLKETGKYFSVRFIEEDADKLYANLYDRSEKRDDAGIVYNKYFFKKDEIRRQIRDNNVDALMVVVISGITKRNKLYSSNHLSYLESDYNGLIMTAQVIDADGALLWEYPNFRQSFVSLPDFYFIQYPDFDEAAANETDKVEVKFKTLPGITRALQRKEKDVLRRELRVSRLYSSIFSDMISLLTPSSGIMGGEKNEKKEPKPAPEAK